MPMTSRRRILQATSAATIAVVVTPPASRAEVVLDNLKIVCGYPPGGTSDLASRLIAGRLTGSYAKVSVVDNRPGAAGRIAVDAVKLSPPNGTTMLLTPSSVVTLYPHIYRSLSYDSFKDLTPISVVCDFAHGLAIGPEVPRQVKTLAEFIDWAKANPGQANCGNPGEGSLPHLLTIILAKSTGAPIQAIPYRGGSPALMDLIGGRLAAVMTTEGSLLQYAADGRARVIATSGGTRSQFLPDVPTFAEQGVRTIAVKEWFGLFMPPGAPAAIVNRAADAVRNALAQKEITDLLAKSGMTAAPSTPAELMRTMRAEHEYWGANVKAAAFSALD